LINPRRWSLNSALLYSAKQANIGALSGILLKTLIGHRDGHDGLADKTVRMRKVDGDPDSGNPFVVAGPIVVGFLAYRLSYNKAAKPRSFSVVPSPSPPGFFRRWQVVIVTVV
jgi:hypothetical protein